MNNINFKELVIYTDIAKENSVTIDARKELSNLLYSGTTGIVAHALALKIYNSDGEVQLTAEEQSLLIDTVNKHCTPAFIDCIKTILETGLSEIIEMPV